MELLTILLSGLLTGLSVAGIFVDNAVESRSRQRFENVDQLEVRIENAPSYRLLGGEVDRVRIASRGVQLTPNIRLEALEVETDPLNVDLGKLRSGEVSNLRTAFNAPLQAGVRVVLTEADLNQAFQSPRIQALLQRVVDRIATRLPGNFGQVTAITSPQITLLENGRVQFQGNVQLQSQFESQPQDYQLMLETGLEIVGGQQVQLVNPRARVNGRRLPPVFVSGFARQLTDRLNLSNFDNTGILARLLQLKVEDDQVEVATFVRVESLPSVGNMNNLP